MSQLDTSFKHNRQKEVAYWNLRALNDMHSISEMIIHSPYPKLYCEKDRDWRNLYFLNEVYVKGNFVDRQVAGLGRPSSAGPRSLFKQPPTVSIDWHWTNLNYSIWVL